MSRATPKVYPTDTLTAEERLEAVVRLERPDRVPVALFIYYFAPAHCGIRVSEFMRSRAVYARTMRRVYEDIGPWDIFYNADSFSKLLYSYSAMMRVLWPGVDLPEGPMAQTQELPYMGAEEYDRLLESRPFMSDFIFRLRMIPRFCNDAAGCGVLRLSLKIAGELARMICAWRKDFAWYAKRGTVPLMGTVAEMPFDTFSQARSIVDFSMDLFKRPETVRKAALKLTANFAGMLIGVSRLLGVPRVQLFCHRTSNSFLSPAQFEQLAFPSLELAVHRIIEAGMTPILHCDGDWLKNLKILRRLPPRKAIIEFDGFTDLFRAKEELGGHTCIYGDVPAEKLVLGSPQEIQEYCHRLIEEVGKDGGFILSSGCEVPYNARPENLRAMVQTAVRYGVYSTAPRLDALKGAAP